jgi:hypothetical protein
MSAENSILLLGLGMIGGMWIGCLFLLFGVRRVLRDSLDYYFDRKKAFVEDLSSRP